MTKTKTEAGGQTSLSLDHRLAPHFTFGELTHSDTGQRLGLLDDLRREASAKVIVSRLRKVAEVLEYLRGVLGAPIQVTSGYRTIALNKAIGGSSRKSQHMTGSAADFVVPDLGSAWVALTDAAKRGKTPWPIGQVILESHKGANWIHVSLDNREGRKGGQVMTYKGGAYRTTEWIDQPHPPLKMVPVPEGG